ncbi:MAG: PilZ domain-containing protein [Dechloromonas sp.]|nr:PilZ domain-containing protein [Dechloromonas sp.]
MTESNRRQFSRVIFQAEGRLVTLEGELQVAVLDLSLKGALIRPPADFFIRVGSHVELDLFLGPERDLSIQMSATVVHHQGEYFGLAVREMDLDSMTHLRRLVELNLGDESLLERDLGHLAHV